jgi:ATP/maltotriose-dependent transcriptional regulator MalT
MGDAAAGVEPLMRAWSLAERGGIFSLARFPALPDAIEALATAGDVERAADLASHHERIAQTLGRPWALALWARSEALIAEARGEHARATAAFERALREHERQPRPLDHARTLLAYGRCERRRRQKSKARALLERSAEIFDAAEARGWAELTRTELARIGGRRPAATGRLSASESAIARLAASGKTNREVAAALHLSDRTVEWNLSKVYRKLGVRSRTELVRALAAGESPA